MAPRSGLMAAYLSGVLAAGAGRLGYIFLLSVLMHLVGEVSGIAPGSLWWAVMMFFSPWGWLPYLIWGGLFGITWAYMEQTSRRQMMVLPCLLLLFLHEVLWYRPTGYRITADFHRLGVMFSAEYWLDTGRLILLVVWFAPHAASLMLIPLWRRWLEGWLDESRQSNTRSVPR